MGGQSGRPTDHDGGRTDGFEAGGGARGSPIAGRWGTDADELGSGL